MGRKARRASVDTPGSVSRAGKTTALTMVYMDNRLVSPCLYMLIPVSNKPDEAEIPEIWENEEEKGLSTGNLKKKYIAAAKSRFMSGSPTVVVNKNTGWPIALSGRVISEWRIKSRTRERILSIRLLDTMIERAKFLETVTDAKNTQGIESVSYFEGFCRINGKPFKINITVKKQKTVDRRFAYYYSATEFEGK